MTQNVRWLLIALVVVSAAAWRTRKAPPVAAVPPPPGPAVASPVTPVQPPLPPHFCWELVRPVEHADFLGRILGLDYDAGRGAIVVAAQITKTGMAPGRFAWTDVVRVHCGRQAGRFEPDRVFPTRAMMTLTASCKVDAWPVTLWFENGEVIELEKPVNQHGHWTPLPPNRRP